MASQTGIPIKAQTFIEAEENHLVSLSAKGNLAKRTSGKNTTTAAAKIKTSQRQEFSEITQPVKNSLNQSEEKTILGSKLNESQLFNEDSTELIIEKTISTLSTNLKTNGNIKKSKSKNSKTTDWNKQNISVKSSFNKFDQLEKNNFINVRSFDAGKTQILFSNPQDDKQSTCRICLKPVYKMEEIKAEKHIFHQHCLRCSQCNKQLKLNNYKSHEGIIYCVVHFKLLFAPKFVEDSEPIKPRKAELIIRENQPIELPPDVVRASDKPDLGLAELKQLNVRSKFQVFENGAKAKMETQNTKYGKKDFLSIKQKTSILSKLAKLQQHGLNNAMNSDKQDASSGTDDKSDVETNDDEKVELVQSRKCIQQERPIGLGDSMHHIKSKFEKGHMLSKEERREERKQEIQNIRSRLFMGKQAKIKEMYQQAVAESEQGKNFVGKKLDIEIGPTTRSIMNLFEKGEVFNTNTEDETENSKVYSSGKVRNIGFDDESEVFESATSKKSRSIFMELDANASSAKLITIQSQQTKTPVEQNRNQNTGITKIRGKHDENVNILETSQQKKIVKYDEKLEDVKIETSEISEKFKFFETYQPTMQEKKRFCITPPREGVDKIATPEGEEPEELNSSNESPTKVLVKSQTSIMLNKFREMESNRFWKIEQNIVPKPLKCFTPPPDTDVHVNRWHQDSDSERVEESDEEEELSDKIEEHDNLPIGSKYYESDEALKEAQAAARAKQLCARFEKWQDSEIRREHKDGHINIYSQDVSNDSTIETTKIIRERFENMKYFAEKSPSTQKHKVNRFV